MKSLFKVTLLATTMAVVLNAPLAMAAETTLAAAPAQQAPQSAAFKNDAQQSAYALGASLGRYMENSLKEHAKLGIKLDKDQLISRVQDAFARKSKKGEAFAAKFAKEKGVKKTESGLLHLRQQHEITFGAKTHRADEPTWDDSPEFTSDDFIKDHNHDPLTWDDPVPNISDILDPWHLDDGLDYNPDPYDSIKDPILNWDNMFPEPFPKLEDVQS
jgi:hypothetical protein